MITVEQAEVIGVDGTAADPVVNSVAEPNVKAITLGELTLVPAVRSARVRIKFAELSTQMQEPAAQQRITEAVLTMDAKSDDGVAIVRQLLAEGKASLQDVLQASKPDVDTMKNNTHVLFELFRASIDTRQMTTQAKLLLADDEWLAEQDYQAIEKHVASFRRSLSL